MVDKVRALVFCWRRVIALTLLLLVAYTYFFPRWANWNENSRFDLVRAFVDDHTLAIDRYVANTGDYAYFRGHYYSDKAPGMFFLGVPVYASFREVVPPSSVSRLQSLADGDSALLGTLRVGGNGLDGDRLYVFVALCVIAFVTVTVPATILGVVFYWLAGQLGLHERQRLVVTALYALGTMAFPYGNSLIGHQTSASLLFTAFAVLFAIRRRRIGKDWLLVSGFLLGYAAITEYQTVLIGTILGFYALSTTGWSPSTLVRLILGALPPLAALVGYDDATFGTPLPIGYLHSSLWTNVHDQGLVSLTYPHLGALWGITFGAYRGLFYLSPFLLFALPGYLVTWRRREHPAEFWVLLLAPLSFFLFNASSAMWQGGFSVGPRYLVPSLPFLGLAAGIGLIEIWRSPALRPLVLGAVAWSFFAIWTETIAGQAFPDYTPNPLFNLSLPRLLVGDIARNAGMLLGLHGWWSIVPLAIMVLILTILAEAPSPPRPLQVATVNEDAATGTAPSTARWASP